MDTNHGQEDRFATIIIYLKTLPARSGGETVFACAGADAHVRACAATLARGGYRSTSAACDLKVDEEGALSVAAVEGGVSHSAAVLEEAANGPSALCVRTVRGLALLSFSQLPGGGVDCLSWHGGARVDAGGGGKWTAQVFLKLPRGFKPMPGGGSEVRDV